MPDEIQQTGYDPEAEEAARQNFIEKEIIHLFSQLPLSRQNAVLERIADQFGIHLEEYDL